MDNLEELLKKVTGKVDKGIDNLSKWAGANKLSKNTTDLIGLGGNALSNILSNGLETGVGSVINTAGSVVGAINPIAGLAVKAVGGLYNGAFGYDYNDEYINQINQLATSHANREFNTTSNTQLASDILNAGSLGTVSKDNVGREGWLSNKITNKTNELNLANLEANISAHKNALNTAERMEKTTMGNMLKNYKEFGGSLHSNGGIWDTGLNMINNGGKHEDSIYGGVPSGVDSEGIPNLVEEGEVIYDDYVFSDTLEVPRELVKKYKLPKNSTYADAITHLSKEYQEKPNDPIMQNWFDNIYAEFAQSQEQVRLQEDLLNNMNLEEMLNMANYDDSGNIFDVGGPLKYIQSPLKLKRTYDFDTFLKEDSPFSTYSVSSNPGGTAGTYKVDTNFNLGKFKTIQDLENSKDYQAFTNYVINNPTDPEVLQYLKAANAATHNKKLFDADGNLVSNWADLYRTYRTDGKGGIYHFTPERKIVTGPSTGYTQYVMPELDLSRPTFLTTLDREVNPSRETDINLSDLLRTAPVVGSTAQVIADMFGANDPDYTDVNALMQAARDLRGIDFTPIGGHLAFNPFDVNYYGNQLMAQANTGNRGALNTSSGNRAAALTGILGSNYNALKGLGELYRQGEESNLANLLSIAQFNNAIEQYNSQGALNAAKANASIDQARASLINKAINLSDDITSASSAAKSANLENFYTNLGLLGEDLFNKDTLQMLIDNGVIVNKDGKYEINQEKLDKLLNKE